MASAEVALVFGLKIRLSCQDMLCVNSNADETLAKRESRYCMSGSATSQL